jgi:hypothetical protein
MRVSTATPHVPPGLSTAAQRLAWRIGLFHPERHDVVAVVAARHPALADLAESFPALLFALATGFGSEAGRVAATEAVLKGGGLQCAAEQLGLAWWTRKLPASVLKEPLVTFPLDADFSRRMASLVPEGSGQQGLWLTAVSEAMPAGGRQYTLWVARHGVPLMGTLSDCQRHAFHAWVWLAWHPGTLGHALVRRPWSNDLGIKRMMDEFGAFLARAALVDALGPGHLGGVVPDLQVHGLRFKPLRTVFDYMQTAAALDNCLEQYADRIRRGTTAVAAIVDGLDTVGCVEVGPHPTEAGMPTIIQLRIAKNRRAPAHLWSAAYAWLAACDMRPLAARVMAPTDDERRSVRAALWGAYLADLAQLPASAAHCAAATLALAGPPPALELTPLAQRLMPRLRGGPEALPADHATLLQRLAWLAGRGAGRRIGM